MQSVTITSINGVPPYKVFFCDVYQLSCITATTITNPVPPSVNVTVPSGFTNAPDFIVKLVDSNDCVFTQSYICPSQTSTPENTPTNTPTPNATPTNTPSSVTPTPTPSNSGTPNITPSFTPSNTVTPSFTPSFTPTKTTTPTLTPTPSPEIPYAYLFIEPISGSSNIGQYLFSQGSGSFFGFTNATQPSSSASTFQTQMSLYVNFSGWTNGEFPKIIKQTVPQTSGGVDSYGNPIVAYNFRTTAISANTVGCQAWYTWLIPTGLTNGLKQTEIDFSTTDPNILTGVIMEPTIYNNTFTYTGSKISNTTYRVYTSYPSSNFYLNNLTNIYFKGGVVS
jgi:hypothetical protein